MSSLNMMDYPMPHTFICFFYGQVEVTILRQFHYLGFVVGPLLHARKLSVGRWVGWLVEWVAYRILVQAPVPWRLIGSLNLLGLGLGWV